RQASRGQHEFPVRSAPTRRRAARLRTIEAVSRFPQLRGAGCAGRQKTPAQDRRSMNPFPDSIRRVANADGGVVLDLRRGAMFRVNPVGARVLDLLEQGDSPAQIAQKLSAEFSVTLSEVQADVIQFVESLETRGILGPR